MDPFLKHELVDRISLIRDLVETHLLGHTSMENPQFTTEGKTLETIERVALGLDEAYQLASEIPEDQPESQR